MLFCFVSKLRVVSFTLVLGDVSSVSLWYSVHVYLIFQSQNKILFQKKRGREKEEGGLYKATENNGV